MYEDAESKLFDVHRMRHIIEPQVNLFASVQSTERDELYQYDEDVDGVTDVAAAQFAVRQRFQTKRGGEGRWRSVDFLTFNSGVNALRQPTRRSAGASEQRIRRRQRFPRRLLQFDARGVDPALDRLRR